MFAELREAMDDPKKVVFILGCRDEWDKERGQWRYHYSYGDRMTPSKWDQFTVIGDRQMPEVERNKIVRKLAKSGKAEPGTTYKLSDLI